MNLRLFYDSAFLLNNKIINTSFESKTRQLFDAEGECYIYYKDTKVLYKIKFDTYINLLLKLNIVTETHLKYEES